MWVPYRLDQSGDGSERVAPHTDRDGSSFHPCIMPASRLHIQRGQLRYISNCPTTNWRPRLASATPICVATLSGFYQVSIRPDATAKRATRRCRKSCDAQVSISSLCRWSTTRRVRQPMAARKWRSLSGSLTRMILGSGQIDFRTGRRTQISSGGRPSVSLLARLGGCKAIQDSTDRRPVRRGP